MFFLFFFFFQAEDGIRDGRVTGVQTCALPIYPGRLREIDERLDAIGNIKRKYGETAAAVAAYRAEIAGALDRLERHDAIAEETEGEVAASAAAAAREAVGLSEARTEGARKLERLIQRELRTLGMDHARFRALLRREPAGEAELSSGSSG